MGRLFEKKSQTRGQKRIRRLGLESLESRLAPAGVTHVWTGAGGTSLWSNAANWTNGVPTTNDNLIFGTGAAQLTNSNNLSSLVVNTITFAGSNYTLNGNKILLGANLAVASGATGNVIGLDVQFSTSSAFSVNTGTDLTVLGHLSGAASAALTKKLGGTLTLSNDNSNFLGVIDVQAGTLVVTNAKALGSTLATANTIVEANASLQVNGGVAGISIAEAVKLNAFGTSNAGAIQNTVGNNTWAGAITLDSDVSLGANLGTSLSVSGIIGDSGTGHNLAKVGTGEVIFTHVGGNTYRGTTTVQNGILTIQDPLSLGMGLSGSIPQVETAQSGTIVTSLAGLSGTLRLNFVSLAALGDANGVLKDRTKVFDAVKNPYLGFQVFNEQLTLNGAGFNGMGALVNANGNNIWNGSVFLGSPAPSTGSVAIAVTAAPSANANTDLTISGVISDPNRTTPLDKIGTGRLILDNNNTYHGNTRVLAGALNIRDSHALGKNPAEVIPGDGRAGGTVSVITGAALELGVDSGLDGTTLRTHNRNLGYDSSTKNGPVQQLYVAGGPGTFTAPNLPSQEVYVSGTIGTFTLSFNGVSTGALAFTVPASGGVGATASVQNALNALSTINAVGGVTVTQTGKVYRVTFNSGAQALSVIGGSTAAVGASVVVTPIYGLNVTKAITLSGTGILNTGALRSVSGINTYSGSIALSTVSTTDAIGVDPDARLGHPTSNTTYFTNDYSLTVTGGISGSQKTALAKVGTGQLILPTANTYSGPTIIQEGWVTVQDNLALGDRVTGLGDTVQPAVTVQEGASLHLKPLVSGKNLVLAKNFVLSGVGITNAFSGLSQEGAIVNLGGVNTLTGDVQLRKNVGIGVQNFDGNPSVNQSQLTMTGTMSEFVPSAILVPATASGGSLENASIIETGSTSGTISISFDPFSIPDELRIYYGPRGTPGSTRIYDSGLVGGMVVNAVVPYGPPGPGGPSTQIEIVVDEGGGTPGTAWTYTASIQPNAGVGGGGLTKLGTNRLILQGDGTYTGAVDVKEGTLRVQNNSALGHQTSGTASGTESFTTTATTVETGASLELGANTPANNGGVQDGVQVSDENLVLNAPGQQIAVSGSSGTFQLSFNGQTTGNLAYNIPASGVGGPLASVQNALNALTSIGLAGGFTTVTKSGSSFIVVFGGTLVGTSIPLTATPTPNTLGDVAVSVTGLAPPLVGLSNDILWGGSVSLATNTTLSVRDNVRLTLAGQIDDASNASATGSTLTKTGNGELVLKAANTYRGTTFVNQGIVTIANSQALGDIGNSEVQKITLSGTPTFVLSFGGFSTGVLNAALATITTDIQTALNNLSSIGGVGGSVTVSRSGNVFTVLFNGGSLAGADQAQLVSSNPSAVVTTATHGYGGTIVANGAQLQLRGNLTVAGESLILQGTGVGTTPVVPGQWFSVGPGPINNGQTAGSQAVTGRVTGVAVDPTDSNVMYISTAGGGAWKTKDNGKTWTQLFDGISAIQQVTVTGTAGTFRLRFGTDTTTDLAYNATPEEVQAALNALNSIGGNGGSVTVTLAGNVYTVTFSGGSLAGKAQPAMIASGAAIASVVVVANGAGSQLALFSGAIAISPSDPRVIYLGTGEANNSGDSFYGTGVYKSSDSGHTWALLTSTSGPANPLNGAAVSRLVVSATNPNLIFVSTSAQAVNGTTNNAGVWRYNGTTWFNLTGQVSDARALAPGTPGPDDNLTISFPKSGVYSDLQLSSTGILYMALGNIGGSLNNAVYHLANPGSVSATAGSRPIWLIGDGSANGGSKPFPTAVNNGNIKIAVLGSTIYAAVTVGISFPGGGGLKAIYKSLDNGLTWAATAAAPTNYQGNQGWYDSTITIKDANTVYVAGVVDYLGATIYNNQVIVTTDGGATWKDVSIDSSGNGPHTDEHASTIDSKGRLVVGNDGGVWRLDPTTNKWSDLNGNLAITTFNGISVSPNDPRTILGGSQDNGTELTTGSQAWTRTDDGDGGVVRFDPKDPNVAYHTVNGSLSKSTDGGNTWFNILDVTGNLYFPFVVDTIDGNRLVVGSDAGPILQESLDQGATFNNIGANLPLTSVSAIGIATYQGNLPDGTFQFDPGFPQVTDKGASTYNPDTIYVTDGNKIEVTKDHGASWQKRNLLLPPGTSPAIQSITVDPRNSDTAYVVTSNKPGSGVGPNAVGRVYVTTDAGLHWTNISYNLPDVPASTIVIDPRSSVLYLGNDNGVWSLAPAIPGIPPQWQRFGAGLPDVQVSDLDFNLNFNTLTAGTYGRSAFQFTLDDTMANSGALRVQSGTSIWTGPVRFAGATNITVDGTQALQNGSASAQLEIVGPISDLTVGSNYRFDKAGLGILVLSDSNKYGGVTEVHAGILVANNAQALGTFRAVGDIIAMGGTVVDAGASLELESDLLGEPVQIQADGVAPGLNGHNTGSLRNISSNAAGNNFTGNLTLLGNSTIGVDSGSQLNLNGQLIGGFDLIKELTGTLVLAGNNTAFTGATTVNQGALQVQNANALGIGATMTTVLDGAQIQIQAPSGSTGIVVNKLLTLSGTGLGGSGALLNTGGNNTWAGNIIFSSLPGFSPFTTPSGIVSMGSVNPGDTLTIGGSISETSPTGLTKVGSAKLVLQQANTYSGSTYVPAGILEIQDGGALGLRGSTTGTAAVQQIVTLNSSAVPGPLATFIVSFPDINNPGASFSTTLIYGDTATTVQNALNALLITAGYPAANVIVNRTNVQTTTQSGAGAAGTGYLYTVTFQGTLLETSIELSVTGAGGTVAAESKVADGGIGVLVSDGAELDLRAINSPVTTPAGLKLTLNGTGVGGTGALKNITGNNAWSGPVNVATPSTINVNPSTTLAFSDVGSGSAITKTGAGSLQVDGVFSNDFAVNAGTLSGNGRVGNVIVRNAKLNAGDNVSGNPIGTLTTANVLMNATDQVFVDLGATGINDLLMVDGTINLAGILAGSLSPTAAIGDQFTIIQTDYAADPTHTITGQFSGGNFVTIAGVAFFADYFIDHVLLTQIGDATHVTSSNATSVYGETVTFTATVPGSPAGKTVKFYNDGVLLGNGVLNAGVFTYSTARLTVGAHTITAVCSDGTSGALTQTVNQDTTTVTLTSNNNPSGFGDAVTFTVVVSPDAPGSGNPSGFVDIYDGATLLASQQLTNFSGGGQTSFTTSLLSLGHHLITATYRGDTNFITNTSANLDQNVIVNAKTATTTSKVTNTPSTSVYGQSVTLTATVSGSPSGTVTFYSDGNVVGTVTHASAGTVYTLATTSLPVGTHSITASYGGNATFAGSNDFSQAAAIQTVNKAATTMGAGIALSTTTGNQPLTISVNLGVVAPGSGIPTGNVRFYIDGTLFTVALNSSGVASFTLTAGLPAGTHTFQAIYDGDSNFTGSTTSRSQTFTSPPPGRGT